MKLNYLLAAAPFAASVIAAPSPEGNTTPLDLETRDGDVIGRISSTACGDVTQLKGKAPTTVNNQWFMFTYETTCKDGTKISITADQSCTQDSFWESIKKAFTFNLAPFNVDSGDYKGQMEVDIDLFSLTPGAKITFKDHKQVPLGKASNLGQETNDHAKCQKACLKKMSVDGDGQVSMWENVKDIPKDFGCEEHGGAKSS